MAQPTLHMTAAVIREGGLYVARCVEVEVMSQGETFEESVATLREALELYFEDEPAPLEVSHPIVAPVEVRLSA
jgi:predicted RNase H-like HicB family nuclease